jgi:geranylgeranyl diphosphate synthase type I
MWPGLVVFGLPLGEAFQLRDDLLGVFGDPSVTGKPVGDDLREGKPTLLASLARAQVTRAFQPEMFEERFGSPDLSESEVLELRAVIEDTGARRAGRAAIERLAAAAGELRSMPSRSSRRRATLSGSWPPS